MSDATPDRKAVGLDRVAHGWLKRAADEAGLSVKSALEEAIQFWARVTLETDMEAEALIESAVALREARALLSERTSVGDRGLSDVIAGLQDAVPAMDEELESQFEPWETVALYSTDWERTEQTAPKVGPSAFETVKEAAEELDRPIQGCVEEAVQLWCILQNEGRGEAASEAARIAREVLGWI